MTAQPDSPVPGLSGLTIIARGGYATVYRARQDSIGRDVALKLDTRTLADERDRRRFLREAAAAGRMSGHPHIVHLYDAGVTADNHPYLVMELCSGGSYAALVRQAGPLSPAVARDLGIKIADALQAAHDAGVLHRDVKPGNVLRNRFGVPGLADFGLAAVMDANRDTSVTVEALTPAYAPPEVFRLEKPTEAGDVYSLCATLYTLLAGQPARWPNSDVAPSPLQMMALLDAPILDIAGVPDELVDVLRRGMANDVAARFGSAGQLRDALADISVEPERPVARDVIDLATQPYRPDFATKRDDAALALATPPSSRSSAAATAPITPSPTPVPTQPRRWLLPALLVTLLVLTALVSGVTWWRWQADEPESKQTTAAASGAGCEFTEAGVRCPSKPECFDELRASGGNTVAADVACTKPHAWETFAIGRLPDTVVTVDSATVRRNVYVRTLCGERGLRTALRGASASDWQTEILPPSRTDLAAGRRDFRCLAGKAPKLDRPVFASSS